MLSTLFSPQSEEVFLGKLIIKAKKHQEKMTEVMENGIVTVNPPENNSQQAKMIQNKNIQKAEEITNKVAL